MEEKDNPNSEEKTLVNQGNSGSKNNSELEKTPDSKNSYEHKHLKRLATKLKTSHSWIESYMVNYFIPRYENNVLGAVYLFAAFLVIIIGLRGLGDAVEGMLPEFLLSPDGRLATIVVIIALVTELFMILMLAIVMFYKPEDIEQHFKTKKSDEHLKKIVDYLLTRVKGDEDSSDDSEKSAIYNFTVTYNCLSRLIEKEKKKKEKNDKKLLNYQYVADEINELIETIKSGKTG